MPFFSLTEGTQLFADDICDSCDLFPCEVYTDLNLEGRGSPYHEKHIVRPGTLEGERDYLHCRSWQLYTAPADRQDPDPEFGRRISAQEANLMQGLDPAVRRPDIL